MITSFTTPRCRCSYVHAVESTRRPNASQSCISLIPACSCIYLPYSSVEHSFFSRAGIGVNLGHLIVTPASIFYYWRHSKMPFHYHSRCRIDLHRNVERFGFEPSHYHTVGQNKVVEHRTHIFHSVKPRCGTPNTPLNPQSREIPSLRFCDAGCRDYSS